MKHLFRAVARPHGGANKFEARRIEPQHAVPPDPRLQDIVAAALVMNYPSSIGVEEEYCMTVGSEK